MTYRLKSGTVNEELFIYENLRRRTNFQCTLLYLTLEGTYETFEELFIPIIYVKMGEKEPLAERSGY